LDGAAIERIAPHASDAFGSPHVASVAVYARRRGKLLAGASASQPVRDPYAPSPHRRNPRACGNAGVLTPEFIRFEPAALPVCSAPDRVRTRASTASAQADSFARMPKPLAYIETTVPNFYYDERTSYGVVSRRLWTREWWTGAAERYELVTSPAVLTELSAGTSRLVAPRLALLDGIEVLPSVPPVADIVQTYIRHKLMPANPSGDALHLALASFYQCDFIVSWDSKHLVNPNKFVHIRRINRLLGLAVPIMVTPLHLLRRT
jgi:predicted nucleic acid-binding protein